MSKIPYADGNGGNEEEEEKRFGKSFWISVAVSSGVLLMIGGLIALIEAFNLGSSTKLRTLHICYDSFGLSGILGICIYLLTYISSKGAFDGLAYGVKLAFLNIFRPKYRQESFPRTYFDYKVLKDSEKRKPLTGILMPSLLFLLVGIALGIAYSVLS